MKNLKFREIDPNQDESGILQIVRSLLSSGSDFRLEMDPGKDRESKMEMIGGIDQEDENGNEVDVDKEFEVFEEYEKEHRNPYNSTTNLELFSLEGRLYVRLNDIGPGGSSTEIYRLKK